MSPIDWQLCTANVTAVADTWLGENVTDIVNANPEAIPHDTSLVLGSMLALMSGGKRTSFSTTKEPHSPDFLKQPNASRLRNRRAIHTTFRLSLSPAFLALSMTIQRYALAYPTYKVFFLCCRLARPFVWWIGFSCYFFANLLFAYASTLTPLTLNATLFTLLLVWNLIFARCMLHEKLTYTKILGAAVIVIGACVSVLGTPANARNTFGVNDIGALVGEPAGGAYAAFQILSGLITAGVVIWFERSFSMTDEEVNTRRERQRSLAVSIIGGGLYGSAFVNPPQVQNRWQGAMARLTEQSRATEKSRATAWSGMDESGKSSGKVGWGTQQIELEGNGSLSSRSPSEASAASPPAMAVRDSRPQPEDVSPSANGGGGEGGNGASSERAEAQAQAEAEAAEEGRRPSAGGTAGGDPSTQPSPPPPPSPAAARAEPSVSPPPSPAPARGKPTPRKPRPPESLNRAMAVIYPASLGLMEGVTQLTVKALTAIAGSCNEQGLPPCCFANGWSWIFLALFCGVGALTVIWLKSKRAHTSPATHPTHHIARRLLPPRTSACPLSCSFSRALPSPRCCTQSSIRASRPPPACQSNTALSTSARC